MIDVQTIVKDIPHKTGVYIMKDIHGTILYVGKAVNLARRVKSYFTFSSQNSDKVRKLSKRIANIEIIRTMSEFDALLLEAKLIQTHMPMYNIASRDDKSPLYIYISLSLKLPSIEFIRKSDIQIVKKSRKDKVFGPFPSSGVARKIMRTLRTVIPFCLQKKRTGKHCFYTQIGLCNPCPSLIEKLQYGPQRTMLTREYRNNIFRLIQILSGKSNLLFRKLEKDMEHSAREQKYERAAEMRDQMKGLHAIHSTRLDPSQYISDTAILEEELTKEIVDLRNQLLPYVPTLGYLSKIECIDISNISGRFATGSLTVLIEGGIDKKWYRKFKIRMNQTPNDPGMIAEVIQRRLTHTEWPYPTLFVVDGGMGQVSAAKLGIAQFGLSIPVIGLAKKFEELIVPKQSGYVRIRLPSNSPSLRLLMRIRDEAHRFALSYHRILRSKSLFSA